MVFEDAQKMKRSTDLERLERLRPIDDDFMRCLFRNNLALARQVLPIMTGETDVNIVRVESQADMKVPGARSVVFDVLCESDDKRIFDLEVEKSTDRGRPKRARYHASVMDVRNLRPRQDFEELPETCIIFLTEQDIYGEGLPRYHADRFLKEKNEDYGDRTHILYVNAQYRDETAFGKLMADFMETDPEKMQTEELRKATYQFKRTEEGRRKMCQVFDEIREEGRQEGRQEGREEGREEGRQEGRKEGEERTQLSNIRSLMGNMKLTAQQAMEALGISPEKRGKLMTML